MSTIRKQALAVVLLGAGTAFVAHADHEFSAFGTPPQVLGVGEAVEFELGGVQRTGTVHPDVNFHLHLFFDWEDPTDPPIARFSPGDVLRFSFGDTSVIYEYDDGANILDPQLPPAGFFDGRNISDNFATGDPIGLGFGSADTNGNTFKLEVLSGDGVRFIGLEFADLVEGTFQMGGASTLLRNFNVLNDRTVLVDFEGPTTGTVVNDQFADTGVHFWGDVIYNEQDVIDVHGVAFDSFDGNFLVNLSATPPLGRPRFIGISLDAPASSVTFDFVGPSPLTVAAFDGEFTQQNLVAVDAFPSAPGGGGFPEGVATLSVPEGFDGLIVAGRTPGVLIDNLVVTYLPVARIDFEGFAEGLSVAGQFAGGMGVSFFGDTVANEQHVIDALGAGFEGLEGNYLVNTSATPPDGQSGHIGMAFDRLASKVSFDFAGPGPLSVAGYRGPFVPANIVATQQFAAAPGPTGVLEGTVTLVVPGGVDGVVVTDGATDVFIDNLTVVYLPE